MPRQTSPMMPSGWSLASLSRSRKSTSEICRNRGFGRCGFRPTELWTRHPAELAGHPSPRRNFTISGGCDTEQQVGNRGIVSRAIDINGPRQCGGDIVDPDRGELVRNAVSVFYMSPAHDADGERARSIATHSRNGLRHGAIPEQLSPNETFEPCRIHGRAFPAGRVLLEPFEQAFPVAWRGRRGTLRLQHASAVPGAQMADRCSPVNDLLTNPA